MTRASILIPTHNKPTTLPLTVDSVLRQSVSDLEVLLIGDGVTDEVRAVIEGLVARDERVRFLDFAKGPHHGERYRHDAVLAAESEAIFYLCDDDLLLPDHVSDLLGLLEKHTFVQSLNGFCRPDGSLGFYAADLSDPATIALHLDPVLRHNSVSITGTAHRRSFYEAVGRHWDTTPDGEWPDHHQWRKLMAHPDFSGATSARMTALQFPTSQDGRDQWSAQERLNELSTWHQLVIGPDAQARIDSLVEASVMRELAQSRLELGRLSGDFSTWRAKVADRDARLREAHDELAQVRTDLWRTRRQLARLERRLALKNQKLAELRGRLRPRS
ncbi:glycosyltransferase [Nocardioides sp.]|uniref:glycosyltransferase family 2 protein n=1 Tax=Nocardioides sp. TaxID=35761 RepID=UPI003568AB83